MFIVGHQCVSHLRKRSGKNCILCFPWDLLRVREHRKVAETFRQCTFSLGNLCSCWDWGLQARQKSTKINFLGSGDRPVGWGSSTRRGGGRKLRARPRKFVFLGFRREESGMSREVCRDVPDSWGCSKSLCKKSSCAFFVPSYQGPPRGGGRAQAPTPYCAITECDKASQSPSQLLGGHLVSTVLFQQVWAVIIATGIVTASVAEALAIYRIESPPNPENWRKIAKNRKNRPKIGKK